MVDPSSERAGVPAGRAEPTPGSSAKTAVTLYPSGVRLSFAELDSAANKLARFLRGVRMRRYDSPAFFLLREQSGTADGYS